MDGFDPNEGIIVIASTNRPDVLDPALLRCRPLLDRQVVVPNPDIVGRERILRVHKRNVPLAADVDVKVVARGTPGFSGADLANLVNEAALMAARKNRRMVTHADFEEAKDKVMMGAERKSMVMTDEEKRMTAYHEGGHALVTLNMPAADPLHKVTIIPKRQGADLLCAAGLDHCAMDYQQMTSRLAILYGGRVAEELIFGKEKVSSGASNDISQATKLARLMVTKWGYSEALGIVEYGENQEEVFLGHSVARNQNVSEDTAKIIDAEVKRLTQGGYEDAKRIMTEKLEDLHTLARSLLEYETLSGDEIIAVLKGIKPRRDEPDVIAPPGPRSSVPLAPRPASVPIPISPGAAPGPPMILTLPLGGRVAAQQPGEVSRRTSPFPGKSPTPQPLPAGGRGASFADGDRQRHAGQLFRRRRISRS